MSPAAASAVDLAERAVQASRSKPRELESPAPPPAPDSRAAAPSASPEPAEPAEPEVTEAETETEAEPATAGLPAPIGGLTERQMERAATIVRVGQEAGLPEHAYVVAIATALQESYLRVLASPAVPESFNHPNDGSSADYDSVGLFQQRTSQGWGTVAQLMDPAYAAGKFYQTLRQVPGWEGLPVTVAAQAVQNSAYPDYYAKHEPLARQLVAALA